MVQQSETSTPEKGKNDEQEHITVARALQQYLVQARMAKIPFPIKFPTHNPRPLSGQQPPASSSKILPFICPRPARNKIGMVASGSISTKIAPQNRPIIAAVNETMIYPKTTQGQPTNVVNDSVLPAAESIRMRPQKFPAAGAAPYIPIRHLTAHHRVAPPVTIRSAVPVFSSPPLPSPSQSARVVRPSQSSIAPPVCVRQAMPVLSPPTVGLEQLSLLDSTIKVEEAPLSKAPFVKFEEPLGSKVPVAQLDNLPSTKAIPGKAAEPQFAKPPNQKAEESLLAKTPNLLIEESSSGSMMPPSLEVLSNQVEVPVPKISKDSPATSMAP